MTNDVLTPIVAGRIWAFERPIWFSGIKLRTRTTVLRLDDGNLLLHSPAPPSDALAAALDALGTVRWLVVPNAFHHLGAPPAAARFSSAKVVGPASAAQKNAALRLDADVRDAGFWKSELPELDALPLDGVPFLDETVLFHRPTRTLIGADVSMAARPSDHFTTRWAGKLFGFYERLRVPPDVKHKIPDKAAASRSIRAIVERPAERLVLAHADVLEGACGQALAEAWRREGVDV